eukprot:1155803-Pelagomonas_calceolata.AAC.5
MELLENAQGGTTGLHNKACSFTRNQITLLALGHPQLPPATIFTPKLNKKNYPILFTPKCIKHSLEHHKAIFVIHGLPRLALTASRRGSGDGLPLLPLVRGLMNPSCNSMHAGDTQDVFCIFNKKKHTRIGRMTIQVQNDARAVVHVANSCGRLVRPGSRHICMSGLCILPNKNEWACMRGTEHSMYHHTSACCSPATQIVICAWKCLPKGQGHLVIFTCQKYRYSDTGTAKINPVVKGRTHQAEKVTKQEQRLKIPWPVQDDDAVARSSQWIT